MTKKRFFKLPSRRRLLIYLSIALLIACAYFLWNPGTTIFHRFPDLHWEESYFRDVAKRCDQMAVMMYDTSLRNRRLYQNLIKSWTCETLDWAAPTPVLLGVPAYDDPGVGYHDPTVENIELSLPAIHSGLLAFDKLPTNYQGVAIYSEWTMTHEKWQQLKTGFLKP